MPSEKDVALAPDEVGSKIIQALSTSEATLRLLSENEKKAGTFPGKATDNLGKVEQCKTDVSSIMAQAAKDLGKGTRFGK